MALLRKWGGNTVRIDLGDGDWVEVRDKLGIDDERWIKQRILNAAKADGKAMAANVGDMADASEFASLERVVVAWSDSEPVTEANLRAIPQEKLDILKAKLNDLYPAPLTKDQAKN